MAKSMAEHSMALIESLLVDDKVLSQSNLARFVHTVDDPLDPEVVRQEMESWYRTLGIETVLGRRFQLDPPPFTRAELEEARAAHQLVLCVPRGLTRRQLADVFRLDSWAVDDELVPEGKEVQDFWFTTGDDGTPTSLNRSGAKARQDLDAEGKLGMTLSRYMAFVARMRFVSHVTPDLGYMVWLTRSQYDHRGLLVAGFDRLGHFRVHAWMPSFQGGRCGVRAVLHPDHL